jgi:two-component system response regulator HydG
VSTSEVPRATRGSLLIVDDEIEHGNSLRRVFEREHFSVHTTPSAELALDHLRHHGADLILTDLMLPGMSGQDLLKTARTIRPTIDVIVMTAYGTVEAAVAAMREGAYDFIQKPFKSALVIRTVERALERQALKAENVMLRRELAEIGHTKARPIIGGSPAMVAMMETVQQAAPSTASVLIRGESGTGKELVARAIHERSPRASAPLVVVNCAALPETILLWVLFVYEMGAYTAPNARKEGRIERADGGTLFLDEVAEMSPPVQAKLLRVLQEGEIDRLGGSQPVQVDFRLVSATNQNLEEMVKEGKFREDLYYRLDVISIHLPPLRERPEDILLIADHFARQLAHKNKKEIAGFSEEAREALRAYRWPGNVRELENVVERAVVLARSPVIGVGDLPRPVQAASSTPATVRREGTHVSIPLGMKLDEVERILIHETLRETGGDKSLAAQLLGIAPRTIYRRLENERAPPLAPDVTGSR